MQKVRYITDVVLLTPQLTNHCLSLPIIETTNTTIDNSSQTALHFATSKLNLPAAKSLLTSSPPASTRVKDIRGQYPIHRAAAIGSVPLVQLLIANKSPIDATDIAGQTPLHHAVAEGHGDTAVALLKAGASTDKKDSDGILALDLAPDSQVSCMKLLETTRKANIE